MISPASLSSLLLILASGFQSPAAPPVPLEKMNFAEMKLGTVGRLDHDLKVEKVLTDSAALFVADESANRKVFAKIVDYPTAGLKAGQTVRVSGARFIFVFANVLPAEDGVVAVATIVQVRKDEDLAVLKKIAEANKAG